MRDEGIFARRRESQTIWYRIAEPRVERLFATLYERNCKPWLVPPHS
jgi:ArsR family transcriptional regulator, virulence genes transcriptional regulator